MVQKLYAEFQTAAKRARKQLKVVHRRSGTNYADGQPKTLYINGKILYNKNNKPRRGTTDEEGEYSYGQVCREAGQDRRDI